MEKFTELVLSRLDCKDERARTVLTKLIIHLHDFIRDLKPTQEEWLRAVDFLTRTGQFCTDKDRNSFFFQTYSVFPCWLIESITTIWKEILNRPLQSPFFFERNRAGSCCRNKKS